MRMNITIDYYQTSGKYFSTGNTHYKGTKKTPYENSLDAYKYLVEQKELGKRPGLNDSKHCDFIWRVKIWRIPDFKQTFLILPKNLSELALILNNERSAGFDEGYITAKDEDYAEQHE